MEKRNSQIEQESSNGAEKRLVVTCDSGVARCQSPYQYEFDVRSVLHGQVNLAAVNHFRNS